MSSILKALRKLEEEKARYRQGTPDIARDILCGNVPCRKSSGWILLCGAFIAISAAGVIAAWFSTSVFRAPPLDPPAALVDPQGARRVRPSAPLAAEAVPAPPAELPSRLAQTVRPEPLPPVRRSDEVLPKTVSSSPPVPAIEPEPAVKEAAPEPVTEAPFLLSGIAYQSDPDARMAIINELPVMRGTVIEGATVEEIHRDRVELTVGDRRLVVRLGPGPSGE